MKFIVQILLIIFITNQILPTIVAFIDRDVTFMSVEDLDGDEESDNCKDGTITFGALIIETECFKFKTIKLKFLESNTLFADSAIGKIFLTPPKMFKFCLV